MSGIRLAKEHPVTFRPTPEPVQAMQFDNYHNGIRIIEWVDACDVGGLLYIVPQGYDHHLRTEREKDNSRGDTLDTAECFMVLRRGGLSTRINRGDYVFFGDDSRLRVMDEEQFESKHVRQD